VEEDTVSFRIRFYWSGFDTDGEVVAFRWTVDPDTELVKHPGEWTRTTGKDTTLLFLVDPVQEVKRHVFMVVAEDNEGRFDPTPAVRYFSAKTTPPTSEIEKGPFANNPIVGPNFTYEWSGIDPDGGETGGRAPVDSFQYHLLRIGGVADTSQILPPWHRPLPSWDVNRYVDMINRATGDTLPYPHGDWRWTGVRGLKTRFRNVTPGEYVFALRAVDIAGATEKNLGFNRHIRHFTVTDKNPGPQLTVNASVLTAPLPTASGSEDFARRQLQIFEGETISFSWSADASSYGGDIVGYNYALDDTSTLGASFDIRLTGVTFQPSKLPPGAHFLFVRCVDDGNLITNAVIPLLIVHPSFKDPGAPREILYVDDSTGPGESDQQIGSWPSDATETNWYTLRDVNRPPQEARFPRITDAYPGTTVTEWDTKQKGTGVEGRKPPDPRDLQNISTVVWVSDFNNTTSAPIALWKAVIGDVNVSYSALMGYLRAGGTLVLTGFNIINCSTSPSTLLVNRTRGLCASFEPGSREWNFSTFPRLFMGVDYVIPSEDGRRDLGARDFVGAIPTPEGLAAGFDTAQVDTGIASSGAKWNSNSDLIGSRSYLDLNLTPGLPRIEGWNLAANLGCEDPRFFGREGLDKAAPIAKPIFRYVGVPVGVERLNGPSPRQNRVVGVMVESHDLGSAGGSTGAYNSNAAIGRIVVIGFPLYFIKNQQASDVLFSAYAYVSASPTLP
jgi:hypothetical protein